MAVGTVKDVDSENQIMIKDESRALYELSPDRLSAFVDPAMFPFESTREVLPLEDIVGNDRAKEAMRTGLNIDSPGYNIYITRKDIPDDVLKKFIRENLPENKTLPKDHVYVHNFDEPDRPILLDLERGQGRFFRQRVRETLKVIRDKAHQKLDHYNFSRRSKYDRLEKESLDPLEKRITQLNEYLNSKNGTNLSAGASERRSKVLSILPSLKNNYLKKKMSMERDKKNDDRQFEQSVIDEIMRPEMENLSSEFVSQDAKIYLDNLCHDICKNYHIFLSKSVDLFDEDGTIEVKKYDINLFVDNSDTDEVPIIFEKDPDFKNLFGQINVYIDKMNRPRSDHTDINAGSLHRSKGGVIVLDMESVLSERGVLRELLSSLRSGRLSVGNPYTIFSSPIDPYGSCADMKVILKGDVRIYHALLDSSSGFRDNFRIKADFDEKVFVSKESADDFSGLVSKIVSGENIRHFDRSAVLALFGYQIRKSGNQKEVSLEISGLREIALEADYVSRMAESERQDDISLLVTDCDVKQAIERKRERSAKIDDYIRKLIKENKIMIDTTDSKIGQVNGLSVMSEEDYCFGTPMKITSSSGVGNNSGGLVHIERKTRKSGSIHDKGFWEIEGYLTKKYGQDRSLLLNSFITFEQRYGYIDGDSASSAELYSLLSDLSDVPVNQGIAVTGSVNQHGGIQPIGGVNEKIEGFYHVCKQSKEGLTGNQGVMIPVQNVSELLLDDEVIDAVIKKQFHIYAVSKVDEGIEVLTGVPAGEIDEQGSINYLVNEKLKAYNSRAYKMPERKGFFSGLFKKNTD